MNIQHVGMMPLSMYAAQYISHVLLSLRQSSISTYCRHVTLPPAGIFIMFIYAGMNIPGTPGTISTSIFTSVPLIDMDVYKQDSSHAMHQCGSVIGTVLPLLFATGCILIDGAASQGRSTSSSKPCGIVICHTKPHTIGGDFLQLPGWAAA